MCSQGRQDVHRCLFLNAECEAVAPESVQWHIHFNLTPFISIEAARLLKKKTNKDDFYNSMTEKNRHTLLIIQIKIRSYMIKLLFRVCIFLHLTPEKLVPHHSRKSLHITDVFI